MKTCNTMKPSVCGWQLYIYIYLYINSRMCMYICVCACQRRFLPSSGHVDTTVWMHHLDANKTAREEARR